MNRHSKALSSALGLALLPLLLSCTDPTGIEQEQSDSEQDQPVVREKPMSLRIHGAAADIEVGQTIRLRAVLYAPDGEVLDSDYSVTWSSSRPERVLITEEGYATGLAPGDSRITAESERGRDWTYLRVRKRGPGRDLPDERGKKYEPEGDQERRNLQHER